jgi:hypothetical protein
MLVVAGWRQVVDCRRLLVNILLTDIFRNWEYKIFD